MTVDVVVVTMAWGPKIREWSKTGPGVGLAGLEEQARLSPSISSSQDGGTLFIYRTSNFIVFTRRPASFGSGRDLCVEGQEVIPAGGRAGPTRCRRSAEAAAGQA